MANLYEEVYHSLKKDIHTRYQIGTFLPPERELMKLYNASRTTIRRSISMLQADGLVDVRQGRGTQVLAGHSAAPRDMMLFHNVTDLRCDLSPNAEHPVTTHGCVVTQVTAPAGIAAEMNLPAGSQVYRMERLIRANGKPFAFFVNFYPPSLVPGLDAFSGDEKKLFNTYPFFEKQYNVVFESAEERLLMHPASYAVAQLLQVEPGSLLLLLHRKAISTEHVVMDVSDRLIRPETLEMTISMRGAPHYPPDMFGEEEQA